MSTRRWSRRLGRAWIAVLAVTDVVLGSLLWQEDPAAVVAAVVIAIVLVVFGQSRKRSRRH